MVVLVCFFLTISDANVFSCFQWSLACPLWRSIYYIPLSVFILPLDYQYSLCILEGNSSEICFTNIFFHSTYHQFTLLNVLFSAQNLFHLMYPYWITSTFDVGVFDVIAKTSPARFKYPETLLNGEWEHEHVSVKVMVRTDIRRTGISSRVILKQKSKRMRNTLVRRWQRIFRYREKFKVPPDLRGDSNRKVAWRS